MIKYKMFDTLLVKFRKVVKSEQNISLKTS